MMAADLATLGLLKLKVLGIKVYNVLNDLHDITNKILSHESNYIVDMVMWPNFGNSIISVIEVTIYIYKDYIKKHIFERCSCFKTINFGLTAVMDLTFYISIANVLKLKVRMF